ncbi:MAG: ABC transporter permease, partial [Planctomycetota bacterium]|nr:ABC transporter permease [Planctomycetota bacterium]
MPHRSICAATFKRIGESAILHDRENRVIRDGDAMSELWEILWLTVRVSGLAVLISAVVGVPLGAWLGLARFRGKSLVVAAVHTGMALPPVVVGLVLFILLSNSGPLASLDWLFTSRAMVVAQTVLALPFVVGITRNAVAAVPADFVLQVRATGASHRQTRWTLLREARDGVALAVAAAFGRSISEVGAVLIVGGNIQGHTRVLTTAIVLETGKGQFQFALALSAVLLGLAVLV